MAADLVTVCDREIKYDKSGVGHCWVPADSVDYPPSIQDEIAAEIIDGKRESCDSYLATNGVNYRW